MQTSPKPSNSQQFTAVKCNNQQNTLDNVNTADNESNKLSQTDLKQSDNKLLTY